MESEIEEEALDVKNAGDMETRRTDKVVSYKSLGQRLYRMFVSRASLFSRESYTEKPDDPQV